LTPAEQAAVRAAVLNAGRIGFDNGLACAVDIIRETHKRRPRLPLDQLADLVEAAGSKPEESDADPR
jgi:hypothetical protein